MEDKISDLTDYEDGAFEVDAFCAWSGVGRTTVYQEIKNGRLETIKVGAKTLILKSAAKRWLASMPRGTDPAVVANRRPNPNPKATARAC